MRFLSRPVTRNTVPRNHEMALDYFSRAAQGGDADAHYNLGVFHLNGWGTEVDLFEAEKHLAIAAEQGNVAAIQMHQQVLLHMPEPVQAPDPARIVLVGLTTLDDLPPPPAQPVEFGLFDERWIAAQPAAHYTIQVIALSSMQSVESLIEGHAESARFAVYVVQADTRPLYVLVQGNYADVESAREARDRFPETIQSRDKLWIRRFEKVQELLNASPPGG